MTRSLQRACTKVAHPAIAALLVGALAAMTGALGCRVLAQTPRTQRFVWQGIIDDNKGYVVRAVSGGDVNRMPEPFRYDHQIHVEFRYVEEVLPDGTHRWTQRYLGWNILGHRDEAGGFSEQCEGGGSIELGPATAANELTSEQRDKLQVNCKRASFAREFRFYERLPNSVPMPVIPDVEKLDDNCAYREESGTRRSSVWLSPDVDAVMEIDTTPGTPYAAFVPEPGKTVEVHAQTKPAYPARFRFVIERDHTSRFPGYAGNAYIDAAFFKRYDLEHLADQYRDDGLDLIFNPKEFDRKDWSVVQQDVVETSTESSSATATVTAMDYGAIGKVRAYVKYKCGGWAPVRVVINGTSRGMVSLPMDEDSNLIADSLDKYKGNPGADDDNEPEGDGTRGDGLTTFEEYRGFMTAVEHCENPPHLRTDRSRKDLFIAGNGLLLRLAAVLMPTASGLTVTQLCTEHLWDFPTVERRLHDFRLEDKGYMDVPDDTRVVNFTLARGNHAQFEGRTVHAGPQHGVCLLFDEYAEHIGGLSALAIPVKNNVLGPPRFTAAVVVSGFYFYDIVRYEDDEEMRTNAIFDMARVVLHELGHAAGVPHHSDSREGSKVILGKLDVTVSLSPLQAAGIPIDSPDAASFGLEPIEGLLIEPGAGCAEGNPGSAYRNGVFAGCLMSVIVRRGQQESGDVWCPMRYTDTDYYEPPGVTAMYQWTDAVTQKPRNARITPRAWLVDAWKGQGGDLLPFSLEVPAATHRIGKYCTSGAGTEENARTDNQNLAGDASRRDGCTRLLVVNDNAFK